MEVGSIPELGVSLGEKLGAGAFGLVRKGVVQGSGMEVAVKLEEASQKHPLLPHESSITQALQGGPGIPVMHGSGLVQNHHYLVLQLLDRSLYGRFRDCGGRLSLPTVLKCTEQILTTFQFLHQSSVIHRDVKPENFLFALPPNSHQLYTIDFGLARKVAQGLLFKPYQSGVHQVVGTMPFVSVSIHLGVAPSFRDDLESIAYLFIYLLQGGLPWYGPGIDKLTEKQTRESKQLANTFHLCKDLPIEFEILLKYARSLSPEEIPDYDALKNAFKALAGRLEVDMKGEIQWNEEVRQKKRSKSEKTRTLGTDKSEATSQTSSFTTISTKRSKRPVKRERKTTRRRTRKSEFQGFNGHKETIMSKIGGNVEEKKEEVRVMPTAQQCTVS